MNDLRQKPRQRLERGLTKFEGWRCQACGRSVPSAGLNQRVTRSLGSK